MNDFRLKVFESVARHLNFTKAARELYISQPAVTRHIRELEAFYGARLFERLGNRIALTKAGGVLLSHAEKILEDYEALHYEMNLLRHQCTGEFRLGASTTIAQYVLPQLLARFGEKFPDVSLSLLNENSSEIERALLEGRIDLGLVEGGSHKLNLRYTAFLEDELVLISCVKRRWGRTESMSLETLRKVPLVLREKGSGTLDVLERALRERNLKLTDMNVKMFLGSTESIKRFLEHADALGIVSIRSVGRELLNGTFRVIELPEMPLPRKLEFIEPQGPRASLADLFVDFADRYRKEL